MPTKRKREFWIDDSNRWELVGHLYISSEGKVLYSFWDVESDQQPIVEEQLKILRSQGIEAHQSPLLTYVVENKQ